MYSVVLMMALSSTGDAPAFGHKKSCSGGEGGCSGAVVYSGCSGSGSCNGGKVKHKREKHSKGCTGGSSCTGAVVYSGCSGSASCSGGSCHGGKEKHKRAKHTSGCSCCGSAPAPVCETCAPAVVYGGCSGSYAAPVMMAPSAGCVGSYAPAIAPSPMPHHEEKKEERKEKKEEKKSEASLLAPATLVVSLPAEAKLMVDDYVTTSASTVRTFSSPTLEAGREYSYTLKAEMVREGKTVTAVKNVTVHAGDNLNVELQFPVAVAQK